MKFGFNCGGCGKRVRKGARARFVSGILCHVGCKPDLKLRGGEKTKVDKDPVYTQPKREEPPLCSKCWTEHRGECL